MLTADEFDFDDFELFSNFLIKLKMPFGEFSILRCFPVSPTPSLLDTVSFTQIECILLALECITILRGGKGVLTSVDSLIFLAFKIFLRGVSGSRSIWANLLEIFSAFLGMGGTSRGEVVGGVVSVYFGFDFLVVFLVPISTVFIRVNFPLKFVNSIQVLFFFLVGFVWGWFSENFGVFIPGFSSWVWAFLFLCAKLWPDRSGLAGSCNTLRLGW